MLSPNRATPESCCGPHVAQLVAKRRNARSGLSRRRSRVRVPRSRFPAFPAHMLVALPEQAFIARCRAANGQHDFGVPDRKRLQTRPYWGFAPRARGQAPLQCLVRQHDLRRGHTTPVWVVSDNRGRRRCFQGASFGVAAFILVDGLVGSRGRCTSRRIRARGRGTASCETAAVQRVDERAYVARRPEKALSCGDAVMHDHAHIPMELSSDPGKSRQFGPAKTSTRAESSGHRRGRAAETVAGGAQ
jgi:hypothetical protein